jgi:hypothetical protein
MKWADLKLSNVILDGGIVLISFSKVHQLRADVSRNCGFRVKLNTLRRKNLKRLFAAACSFYWHFSFGFFKVVSFPEK